MPHPLIARSRFTRKEPRRALKAVPDEDVQRSPMPFPEIDEFLLPWASVPTPELSETD